MPLFTTSEVGNLHLRIADHPGAKIEAQALSEGGRVFLALALPIPLPNVATLVLSAEQAKALMRAIQGAVEHGESQLP